MVGAFLLYFLVALLFLLTFLLSQALYMGPPLVFLHHLILLKFFPLTFINLLQAFIYLPKTK